MARLDFLDLNGKDVAQDAHRTETLTYDMGKKLNIPVVGGSDTHQGVQYGCISTMFGQDIRTLEQLYQKMSIGAYEIHISENAANKVETAGLLKKSIERDLCLRRRLCISAPQCVKREAKMSLFMENTQMKWTKSDLLIMEFIENHTDDFLFMSIGQLAQHLQVSEATISRFARHRDITILKK